MATASVGTKFLRGDGASSEVFAAIAEINDLAGPDKSRGTIETTSLDTTGGYRTFIGSFRDAGQITLEMNFTNAGYDAMNDDFEASGTVNYRVQFPDTAKTRLSFAALVTDLGVKASRDDKITASVTLKVSGVVTLGVWT